MIKEPVTLRDVSISETRDDWAQPAQMQITQSSIIKREPEPQVDADGFVRTLKQTGDMLVGESKTLAPSVVETIKESGERLEERERIIKFIPNPYLYFGLLVVGTYAAYAIIKKVF